MPNHNVGERPTVDLGAGLLVQANSLLPSNLRLFLAGKDREAMTFNAPSNTLQGIISLTGNLADLLKTGLQNRNLQSTSDLMKHALLVGPDEMETWPDYLEFALAVNSFSREFVAGAPTWIRPAASGGGDVLQSSLDPLKHLLFLAASGCMDKDLAACAGVSASPGTSPSVSTAGSLVNALKDAVKSDLAGKWAEARTGYRDVRRSLSQIVAVKLESSNPSTPMARLAQQLANDLEKRIGIVEDRLAQGTREPAGDAGWQVHLIAVAIEDYSSPYVAKLPGAGEDIAKWQAAIDRIINTGTAGRTLRVHQPAIPPKTADALLKVLQETIAVTQPSDLIVFYFSGRGLTQKGRFWLATGDVEHELGSQFRSGTVRTASSLWSWSEKHLVSLDDIAAAVGNRRLVSIYDVQFERPLATPTRFEVLYEKHLDSVRPGSDVVGRLAGRDQATRMETGDGVLRRQVHIWVEGPVSHSLAGSRACTKAGTERRETAGAEKELRFASSLTAALIPALERGKTYKELVTSAANDCIGRDDKGGPVATIVAQGNIDLPIFESGDALEDLVRLKDDQGFRELNLKTALGIANDASIRDSDPAITLSRNVFRRLLAELEASFSKPLRSEEMSQWLADTINAADGLSKAVADNDALTLVHLNAWTRALQLKGGAEAQQARKILTDKLSEVSLSPVLVERLIDLTQLRAQAGPLLDELERALEHAKARDNRRLLELIATERAAAREPFRIRPNLARSRIAQSGFRVTCLQI